MRRERVDLSNKCMERSSVERTECVIAKASTNEDQREWAESYTTTGLRKRHKSVSMSELTHNNDDPVSVEVISADNLRKHHQRRFSDISEDIVRQVEIFAKQVWHGKWEVIPHNCLPKWMKDNEYLVGGHRPPMPSARACLRSIFRLHTETVNIWTHLVGALIFLGWFFDLLLTPSETIPAEMKRVITLFFIGAISCLVCSTVFHIFSCHSHKVCKIFNKIDYCGISMLVMGSFCPWLYYAFHCRFTEKLVYMIILGVLGAVCIGISVIDRFSEPAYRPVRAAVFIVFGMSAVVPCCHHMIIFGVSHSFKYASIAWLIVMGCLYIAGALMYAIRIPERFFPGKCDIWGQSHQIFHVLVVAAAAVHYYGIMSLAVNHHLLCPLSSGQQTAK